MRGILLLVSATVSSLAAITSFNSDCKAFGVGRTKFEEVGASAPAWVSNTPPQTYVGVLSLVIYAATGSPRIS